MEQNTQIKAYETSAELARLAQRLDAREYSIDPALATDLARIFAQLGDVLGDIVTDSVTGLR